MDEVESIPLSALQHYLYCPRQCALIHVEQQWADNGATAEGHLLHARVDTPAHQVRRGVRTATALPLVHAELGMHGIADVVEFHGGKGDPRPFPVEYKRGGPKAHRADEVQLCAQALCLESMFSCTIPEGALFYGSTRRRQEVVFDPSLRQLTLDTVLRVRELIAAGRTPAPEVPPQRCRACSLKELCMPELKKQAEPVAAWISRSLED